MCRYQSKNKLAHCNVQLGKQQVRMNLNTKGFEAVSVFTFGSQQQRHHLKIQQTRLLPIVCRYVNNDLSENKAAPETTQLGQAICEPMEHSRSDVFPNKLLSTIPLSQFPIPNCLRQRSATASPFFRSGSEWEMVLEHA